MIRLRKRPFLCFPLHVLSNDSDIDFLAVKHYMWHLDILFHWRRADGCVTITDKAQLRLTEWCCRLWLLSVIDCRNLPCLCFNSHTTQCFQNDLVSGCSRSQRSHLFKAVFHMKCVWSAARQGRKVCGETRQGRSHSGLTVLYCTCLAGHSGVQQSKTTSSLFHKLK